MRRWRAYGAIASAQALSIQSQLNFTRDNEYAADRIGVQRMVAAGFDPNAMATFMTRMQNATRFSDSTAPSYLRSHPVTFERIAEAQARAASQPYKQVPDSLDFQMVRALLRSYQGEPQGYAVTYFDRAIAEHQYNSEVSARYGLVAFAAAAEGLRACAQGAAGVPGQMAPPHPMIDAMAGHVMLESGDVEGAVARFKAGVTRYPNKMQMVYDYPEALIKAGRPKAADLPKLLRSRAPRRRSPATGGRAARMAHSRQGIEVAPAPGGVLRLAGEPQGRHLRSWSLRPRRTTPISIRHPSSSSGCARCASKRPMRTRKRSSRKAERDALVPGAPWHRDAATPSSAVRSLSCHCEEHCASCSSQERRWTGPSQPIPPRFDDNARPPAQAAASRAVMTGEQVVRILDETVDWYRTLGAQQQSATQPSDLLILYANRQIADRAIGLAFEIARANAELLSSEADVAQKAAADAASSPQALQQVQRQLDARRADIQAEIASMQRRLATAPKAEAHRGADPARRA